MQVTKTGSYYSIEAKNYKPTDKDLENDFVKAMQSWTEGSKKSELTNEEMKELNSKYNLKNMSQEDNINLLGDLVELGLLTKMDAANIYTGFVPIDRAKFEIARQNGTVDGFFSKCDIQFMPKQGVGLASAISGDVIKNFDEMYKHIFENTNVDIDDSQAIRSYRDYMSILAKLATEKQTQ